MGRRAVGCVRESFLITASVNTDLLYHPVVVTAGAFGFLRPVCDPRVALQQDRDPQSQMTYDCNTCQK